MVEPDEPDTGNNESELEPVDIEALEKLSSDEDETIESKSNEASILAG